MTQRPPIDLDIDRDPWEKQTGESNLQYGRFLMYRNLGRSRSYAQTLENLKAMGSPLIYMTIYQAATRYRWSERAEAWDREQDRLDNLRIDQLRRDMIERQQKTARILQGKALQRLQKLESDTLLPRELIAFLKLAFETERFALGSPTSTVAVTGAGGGPVTIEDMSRYTPEQRRARLAELAAELASRAAVSPEEELDYEDD